MELKQLDYFLLKTLYIVEAGIIITQTMGLDSLTSFLFLLTFPLTVFLWIRSIRVTATGMDLIVVGTILLALVNVLIDSQINGGDLSFDYLKKLIMFSMTLLFLQTAYRVRVNENFVSFINKLVDFLTLYLIFMYLFRNPQMHYLNGRYTAYLTFGLANPNLTGLFLISIYMLVIYRLFSVEKWKKKLVHILLAAFLAIFVFESQARNSLLVLVVFTAICCWLIFKRKRNMRIGKVWAAIVSAFPALFLVVYMMLINAPWLQRIFAFMTGEGKNLNSRVYMWKNGIRLLVTSPLIGTYSQIPSIKGTSHLHNSHLDTAVSYGIPVFCLLCVLLYRYLYQNGRQYKDKGEYMYILSFCCTILLGIGEAALFSGGLGMYILAGAFLLMTNLERGDKPERI